MNKKEFYKKILELTEERLAHLEKLESTSFSVTHAIKVNKAWNEKAKAEIG